MTREHGWRMSSANCPTGSATARTSQDSCPELGQRKTKSLPSSTNYVLLVPTLYKLDLVGPNSNILCQINTVFTGCLQSFGLGSRPQCFRYRSGAEVPDDWLSVAEPSRRCCGRIYAPAWVTLKRKSSSVPPAGTITISTERAAPEFPC